MIRWDEVTLTDIYEWADNLINSSPRYATGFTQLLATKPYRVSAEVRRSYDARLPLIRSFQQTALQLFRAALNGKMHPAVLHWLVNETPNCVGLSYHRKLEDRHFTLPVFFRTDEVTPGRIIEIQCPGSAWGELQVVFEYAADMGYLGRENSPADRFATQLIDFLKAPPLVDHLLDNASAPAGMRYFIEKTRPRVRYWNIDRGVRGSDCNFIRSHAFFSICSDKDFLLRLAKVGSGVTYDLPPHILFDNKALLVLPFWSLTRESFSDSVRDLFPFTTPLLPGGIELQDGRRVTVEQLSHLPQSQRSYFLKYAGSSLALNWGSRAVYRLSNLGSGACLHFLQRCLSGYGRGEIWLLQKEELQEDEIEYLARDGAVANERLRAKFSGYYGPAGCLGVLVMHRRHFKVHGQEETVLSYVLADGEDGVAA
jgi:hypothetical protein